MTPDEKPAMQESTQKIQAHLDAITNELHHGKNSHEDPDLPENWERLARAERGEDPSQASQDEDLDLRGVAGPETQQKDVNLRNAEAVGGQAPI